MSRFLPIATVVVAVGAALACAPSAGPGTPGASRSASSASCPRFRLPHHRPQTVYQWNQVDVEAKPRPNNPEIPWPSGVDSQLGYAYVSRIKDVTQAEVELRFVVDSAGCADLDSVEPVASTDSAFTLAVIDALPSWRFEPATREGEPVAQLLQWKWVLYKRSGARMP